MRRLLLVGIRSYWRFVRPEQRRTCLFSHSCSRHVFDVTEREGLGAGLKALFRRYRACRPGYRLLSTRDRDGTQLMLLADDSVVRVDQLSSRVWPAKQYEPVRQMRLGGGAAQAVVDRGAEAGVGDRRDGDARRRGGVGFVQPFEQVGGGFDEIA